MNNDERDLFLNSGGILLRVSKDKNGQFNILQKVSHSNWNVLMPVPSRETGNKIINSLCITHPAIFKKH